MARTVKLFKISLIIIFIIIFGFTVAYLPVGGSIDAQSAKIKVYIDAGHGGRDPGAGRYGLQEKTPNLDIALRLKSKLEANGFLVVMTRTGDSYSSLDDRVNKANNSGADIFIAIHNNAVLSPYAHGTETYWNANGVSGSNQFANLVQSNMVQQIGRANRGVKTANFRVIKYTNMPAALVECAFISNPTENELLKSADFLEKAANGLFYAIKAFSAGIDKSSGHYSDSTNDNDSSNNVDTGQQSSGFAVKIESPDTDFTATEDFEISGWAADLKNSPPIELVKVEFYNGPERSEDNLSGTTESFEDNVLGSTGIISGGWTKTIQIDQLNEGENIIYVYAYDENNNYSTANIKINAIKNGDSEDTTNINPVASPGGPYTAIPGEEITFDSSASSDQDGSIVEFAWDFGDESTSSEENPVHAYTGIGEYTVTLTVTDDGGAVSAAVMTMAIINEESTEEEPLEDTGENEPVVQFENISNGTSFVGYIDLTVEDLVRIFENRGSSKVEKARRIALFYIQYGKLFNLRADIAWAQMIHETGFLEYTGDVAPEQNNFVGIGAVGGGVPGDSFATEELGIIAHFAHLSWYYFAGHVNEYCSNQYDPRHFGDSHYKYTGDITLGFLNGRWAPGSTYTDKIAIYANEIIQGINQAENPEEEIVTAEAGEDMIADIGAEIAFDGSASTATPVSEGMVITYSWDWNADGEFDETSENATATHIYEESGIYEVTLKVTAFEDISSTDTLIVTVNEITNIIPIADPGGPYTGIEGEEIIFDGTASSDEDGSITRYAWDFGDGSTGTDASTVHAYSIAGEYTVSLDVTDDSGEISETVTAIVTVEEAATEEVVEESAPEEEIVTADAGEDMTADTGTEITFDGSASTATPVSDGMVITFSWDWNVDGEFDETSENAAATHIFEESGIYEVALKVTAFEDITSTDTLIVTVNDIANKIPIADPGGPYTGTEGEEITFEGNASSDEDGTIAGYEWDFGDGSTGTEASPVHAYSTAGEYTVSLAVTDDGGEMSEAVTAIVTIEEAAIEEEAVEEETTPEEEISYPVNTSPITNITSVIGYTEVSVDQLVKIFIDRGSNKVDWARRIALIYITYGKLFNIRADIAWAQMVHETGFLEYTGDVGSEQNNFVGIGATGGVPGNSFITEELGIIAHYAHLAWYYYPEHINSYCNAIYDPRHFGSYHYRYTGDTSLGHLNGRWAPGATYTDKIILFANNIYGF